MNYSHSLINVLVSSLTSLTFYRDLLHRPFAFSLKVFLTVWLVLTTFKAAVLIPPLYHLVQTFSTQTLTHLPSLYPQDLIVTIKQDRLSTNQSKPYYYPLERLTDFLTTLENSIKGLQSSALNYLFVIDTQASLDDFDLYRTYALITATKIMYYNDAGNLEVIDLTAVTDFTLSFQTVLDFTARLQPYLAYLPGLAAAIALFGLYAGSLLLDLLYLVLLTLVTWFTTAIIKPKLAYRQSFQLNLHTYTWYKIIFTLLSLAAAAPSFLFSAHLLLALSTWQF